MFSSQNYRLFGDGATCFYRCKAIESEDAPLIQENRGHIEEEGLQKLSHKPNVRRHENGISTCLEGLG